jgi:hypothetical protein
VASLYVKAANVIDLVPILQILQTEKSAISRVRFARKSAQARPKAKTRGQPYPG